MWETCLLFGESANFYRNSFLRKAKQLAIFAGFRTHKKTNLPTNTTLRLIVLGIHKKNFEWSLLTFWYMFKDFSLDYIAPNCALIQCTNWPSKMSTHPTANFTREPPIIKCILRQKNMFRII